MAFNEKTITSEKKFEGKIVDVNVLSVELPDKTIGYREIVNHPGGVGIVAFTNDNKMLMVRQFRKAIEKEILEIPAGKLEKGEDPLVCGKRELEEETGFKASEFISLGYLYPSPGFTDEVTHIYLAWGLGKGEVNPDDDEFLDVLEVPVEEVYAAIMNNEINDAKTVIGLFKALEYIKNN